MRTTPYRVLGPGWGIAIDLTAEAALTPAPSLNGDRLGARIRLDVTPIRDHRPADRSGRCLTPAELGWLRYGLELMSTDIEATLPPDHHLLLTAHRVLFPETDFQPKGLAGAMAKWCQEEFTLTHDPTTPVMYAPDDHEFVYAWEPPHPDRRLTATRLTHRERAQRGAPVRLLGSP
ncbi:hypothetical protein ACFQLX_03760 [Streptomyces polyrhachis]|uniref:Uncharacterized protein n=1 Tax=Streptomyces polyrhachis TaxID=1282885 RepID=A0ABW2GE57_9ACTN